MGQNISSSPQRPDRNCGPPKRLPNSYRRTKQERRQPDHSYGQVDHMNGQPDCSFKIPFAVLWLVQTIQETYLLSKGHCAFKILYTSGSMTVELIHSAYSLKHEEEWILSWHWVQSTFVSTPQHFHMWTPSTYTTLQIITRPDDSTNIPKCVHAN